MLIINRASLIRASGSSSQPAAARRSNCDAASNSALPGLPLAPPSGRTRRSALALSRRLDREHLHHAITLWEQALLQTPGESITLAHPSELADLISTVEPEQVSLWDCLRRGARSVDADGWVFDAANWNLTSRLAKIPFNLDGHDVNLRPDTENNLLAWDEDDLWASTWAEARPDKDEDQPSAAATAVDAEDQAWKNTTKYAALRVTVAMKTLHGHATPLVILRPTASRLSNTLRNARTAWLAPKDPAAPLLSLHLGGRGHFTHLEHTSRLALDAWVRLRDDRAFDRRPAEKEFLPASAMDLSGKPGRLRALLPYSVSYPIGKGVGLHTVAELARHASTALGQPLIGARKVPGMLVVHSPSRTNGRDSTLLDDENLADIMEAAGCTRLRVLALYQHQDMRTRMQRLIAYHFNRPDLADGMPEDTVVELGPHAEVVLHCAPELLTHGDHSQRAALTAQLPGLSAPDTGVLALCETQYDEKEWRRQRRAVRHKVEGAVDPYPLDAKPYVSRYLAGHGVIAQFLKPISRPMRSKKKERETTTALESLGKELAADFPGHMAVGDMLRAAGLVHPRLTQALSTGPLGLKQRVAHVGLHMRLQLGDRRGPVTDEPKLMWTLTAFIPHGERQWAAYAYLPDAGHGRRGWFNYAAAQAIHRSIPLPEGSRQDAALPRHIDQALYQLGQQNYILYVSGTGTRALWPGLANKNWDQAADTTGLINGRPALPGLSLKEPFRPRAVIRTTVTGPDLPLPALFENVTPDGETTEGDKTSNSLFRVEHSDTAFLLCTRPHQMDGKTPHARAGKTHSRYAPESPEQQAETWYGLTATEIAVLHHPAGEDPTTYAWTAARLCSHALAWSNRTSHPLPIHAGIQMDKNHPDYRRTISWDSDPDS
ncbi:RNaseH domain-containing protein [Streptomyces sp. NPDC052811]|uniref:RNaseH domain-containing protein n=1 Tax=Streptomyces sp. NPDC052811 TaxID=3155731 RepID=UPI00342413A3